MNPLPLGDKNLDQKFWGRMPDRLFCVATSKMSVGRNFYFGVVSRSTELNISYKTRVPGVTSPVEILAK